MHDQPVRIDDFARYRYVNSVRVAKDARALVYSVIVPDLDQNRYDNDLWTLDLASGAQRRLTSSGREGRFDLMADGSVLFVSGRGKQAPHKAQSPAAPKASEAPKTQAQIVADVMGRSSEQLAAEPANGTDLYRISLDGGEAVRYAHIPLTVLDWRELPDGKLLVRARELSDADAPYAAIEEIPFWENGGTYTSGLRWGLYVVDPGERDAAGAATGTAQVRRITAACESIDAYDVSSDGAWVYVVSSVFETKMTLTNRVARINVASGQEEPMGPEGLSFNLVKLLSADTLILRAADLELHGINTDPQMYLMGVDGSGFRRISPADFDVDFYNHLVTDARQGGGQVDLVVNGQLLYLHADCDTAPLSRIDAQGTVVQLVGGEGGIDSFDTLDGRALYYVAMRPNKLPELYRTVVDDAGAAVEPETCLTDFSAVLEGAVVTEPEQFCFQSNGELLRGYVVKPANYEPGKKYPGILWVHGGPKCDMGNLFSHEIQYLSGLGYFVFYTNPHGSGSHGIEYAASIFGDYGGMDFEDLMTFTDEVLKRYDDIDADRLAEMGGSYGGFMTNWIIGHTDRFRCCNSQRSISNWVSMFGVADIGYYFADDQTLGWPWGNVEAMWDQSPLKYADQVKTPTLFLHSDADYRCPLEQGMQMFTALKIHDVPARLVVFKGENHELSRSGKPQARVRRLAEIANWYGQWLKNDPAGEPTLREE